MPNILKICVGVFYFRKDIFHVEMGGYANVQKFGGGSGKQCPPALFINFCMEQPFFGVFEVFIIKFWNKLISPADTPQIFHVDLCGIFVDIWWKVEVTWIHQKSAFIPRGDMHADIWLTFSCGFHMDLMWILSTYIMMNFKLKFSAIL